MLIEVWRQCSRGHELRYIVTLRLAENLITIRRAEVTASSTPAKIFEPSLARYWKRIHLVEQHLQQGSCRAQACERSAPLVEACQHTLSRISTLLRNFCQAATMWQPNDCNLLPASTTDVQLTVQRPLICATRFLENESQSKRMSFGAVDESAKLELSTGN
jgi:hypothetical protein